MLRSMTGYGKCQVDSRIGRIKIDIKSVNHKYCDISLKAPRIFNEFDNYIKRTVKERIGRGKIDIYIILETTENSEYNLSYNKSTVNKYIEIVEEISKENNLPQNYNAIDIMRFPDVFVKNEVNMDDNELKSILDNALSIALDSYISAKETEGKQLEKDILVKLDTISGYVDEIADRAPLVFEEYKTKITNKVHELLGDDKIDERLLATELVLYSDKICIDEEMVRLRSHIKAMTETINAASEPIGKKLDFMTQELNREANTILSKANDKVLSGLGISLKTEIEKIREQIQNIE